LSGLYAGIDITMGKLCDLDISLIGYNKPFPYFRSEVKEFFADDWIQRRRRIVQQHATQYRRISWGKVWSPK
jgi:hypothetical protein